MTFSPEPTAVRIDQNSFSVDLDEGPVPGITLALFTRLLNAAPNCELERVARNGSTDMFDQARVAAELRNHSSNFKFC